MRAHRDALEPTWKGACPDPGAFRQRSKPTPSPAVAEAEGGELAGAGVGRYTPRRPGGLPTSSDVREHHGASCPPSLPSAEDAGCCFTSAFKISRQTSEAHTDLE